jgi:hypothetical protein
MLANDATSEFSLKKSLTLPQHFFLVQNFAKMKKKKGNIL